MALVDELRGRGHAAVISGAGPSVLVLTTTEHADEVSKAVDESWTVLRPEVPARGAQVEYDTGIGNPALLD
jgi:homoserine kinase